MQWLAMRCNLPITPRLSPFLFFHLLMLNRPFPSSFCLCFKTSPCAQHFISFYSHVHFHSNQTHFHLNGFARELVLKQRQKTTRKWPIKGICKVERLKRLRLFINLTHCFLRNLRWQIVSISKMFEVLHFSSFINLITQGCFILVFFLVL